MPFFKTIDFNTYTQIHVWKIIETFDDFMLQTKLSEASLLRLNDLKTNDHQLGFLSVRLLLQHIGFSDLDLEYDKSGKPFLKNGQHISISHSFEYSTLAISNQKIGIDIELIRSKIVVISKKFCGFEEGFLDQNSFHYTEKLTVIWGAKEAVFKIKNQKGLSFKKNIHVGDFELNSKEIDIVVLQNDLIEKYIAFFEKIENYMLVFVFEKISLL